MRKETLISHKSYKPRGSKEPVHIIWTHYEGFDTQMVKNVKLTESEYILLEQHFNAASSRKRQRIRELERKIRELEFDKEILMQKTREILMDYAELKKTMIIYKGGADNPLNDALNNLF